MADVVRARRVCRRLALTTLCAMAAVSAGASSTAAVDVPKTQQFYVLNAHPDDEQVSWSYYQTVPPTSYVVWVTFTSGEGSAACLTPEESQVFAPAPAAGLEEFTTHWVNPQNRFPVEKSSGAHWYEGPGSPVGEPDQRERHPYGFPWVGQFTKACGDAKVASWHWFLDDMHALDGTGANLDTGEDPWQAESFRGRFCPSKRVVGASPKAHLTCAEVWATDQGARVVFEYRDQGFLYDDEGTGSFGPSQFTPRDVTAALRWLRDSRAEWGMPVLPESGMFAAPGHVDGVRCELSPEAAPGASDHKQVLDALRYTDQGGGPQSGRMACPDDPYGDGAAVWNLQMNPASLVGMNLVDPTTSDRIGPALVDYGWMMPGYVFLGCSHDCLYWTRLPTG